MVEGKNMNVAEYLVSFIEKKQIDRVFGVVGGAVLWICKALNESQKIQPVFTNHEQTAVMAADGWARVSGKPGVVFTINGPGMTNAVTGIAQAWTDSSPVILITGNSNLKSVKYEREKGVRQYGTQDVRTDEIMKPITKKSFLLERPEDAPKCFEEAYILSMKGRPGPVCIEIPINVQSAEVPEDIVYDLVDWKVNYNEFEAVKITDVLKKAKRPLILAGQGIRLAGAVEQFRTFIKKYQIPVVNSRMGIDSIVSDSELYVGRAGNHGNRASHFAIQTCDVLLVIGSRLAPNTTGYDVSKFSNQSYKILIEVEKCELEKYRMHIDEVINTDLKIFLDKMNQVEQFETDAERKKWIKCCVEWKKSYPIMQEKYYVTPKISTYRAVEVISNLAEDKDLILSDTGSCCSIVSQVWNVKEGQRIFISGGLSAMGYWATSMGVAFANKDNGRVICFVGDGSLQMNIQELSTIKSYGLPIKFFVINNNGYQFVRMSQRAYGIEPPFGTEIKSGVPIPEIRKIVEAYGLNYTKCAEPQLLEAVVKTVLNSNQTEVCEIFVEEEQEVCPRLKSVALKDGTFVSPEYHNLYPFLEKDILEKELKKAF